MSAMQDMTKGGAAGHLLRYAVPLMLGNWFQLAYNAADSIIAGRFIGKDALAAEGIAGPVMNLVILGITGVCLGAGVLMSEFFGAKDGESLRRELATTVLSGTAACTVVALLGVLFTRRFCRPVRFRGRFLRSRPSICALPFWGHRSPAFTMRWRRGSKVWAMPERRCAF